MLVGQSAKNTDQDNGAVNIKRSIKLSLNSSAQIDSRTFTGIQIAVYIMNEVKTDALKEADRKVFDESLECVIISVPAAFGHNERMLILQAARILVKEGSPELKVLGLIKEPVAAAISYFQTSLKDKTRSPVYDLGGRDRNSRIIEYMKH